MENSNNLIARLAREWDHANTMKELYYSDVQKSKKSLEECKDELAKEQAKVFGLERQVRDLESANHFLQGLGERNRINLPSDYELNPSQKITVRCVYCREDISVTAESDMEGNLNIGVEGHECSSEEYEDPEEESKDEDESYW